MAKLSKYIHKLKKFAKNNRAHLSRVKNEQQTQLSRAVESIRAEQSRAEERRAEQSTKQSKHS